MHKTTTTNSFHNSAFWQSVILPFLMGLLLFKGENNVIKAA